MHDKIKNSNNGCYKLAVTALCLLIILYVISIGLVLMIATFCILLVPTLMLMVAEFGIARLPENDKILGLVIVIFFQSISFIWWIVNNIAINIIRPEMSLSMITLEATYFWLMLWFFIVIPLNSILYKTFSLYFNPVVLLYLCAIAIICICIFALFIPCILLYR